jgi:carbonic anhydrase/acetyltransferase-like protein (isoleucine patch superfamily)
VGHSVVIHASKVGDRCLIGNNATLLEDVEIGDDCLVAANTLVRVGTKVPPGSFVVGVPAQIRPLSEAHRAKLGRVSRFAERAQAFKESGL